MEVPEIPLLAGFLLARMVSYMIRCQSGKGDSRGNTQRYV